MFSKITPASLCVCTSTNNTVEGLSNSKVFAEGYFDMIDTQMKREGAMLERQDVHEKEKQEQQQPQGNTSCGKEENANGNVKANGSPHKISKLNSPQEEKKNAMNRLEPEAPQEEQTLPKRNRQQNNSRSNGNTKRPPKSLDIRKEEVMAIRNRFPTKVPIIVQRFCKETALPQLDKSKYLVPQEITMSQFLTIIRNRMRISPTQTLYLLVNNRSMISLSLTLAEVYNEYAGVDGFLYVTYASQEVFGFTASEPSPLQETNENREELLITFNQQYTRFTKQTNANNNESRFEAFLDNTYKSMCFG